MCIPKDSSQQENQQTDHFPSRYVVRERAKPDLSGPNSTEPNLEKPHTRLDDSLRVLQACFRKSMSGIRPLLPPRRASPTASCPPCSRG